MSITEETDHGELVIEGGAATPRLQAWMDSVTRSINEAKAPTFTVSTVPDATQNESMVLYISDESGGATLAFSDGVNWLRVQDRAIIS